VRSTEGWRRSRRPASIPVADRTVSPLRRAADGFALATTFLTIVPLPVRVGAQSRWTPAWFPVVGALVGAVAGGVRYGLDPLLGPLPASALAAATLVICTGALHQDGLADLADGLGVRGDRMRRLAVMRDPQVGTFGVLALGLWLLALVSALTSLPREDALIALVVACALGRWSALVHAVAASPARSDGLGAGFVVDRAPLVVATAIALAIAVALEGPAPAAGAAAAALLVAGVLSAGVRRSLGGRTGDTLGACIALAEVAVVLVLQGWARP
jgi:adenosylcobinamide-GDP ribazoletransferase